MENNISLSHLRKVVDKLKDRPDDTKISFEFLLMALFPSIWTNIQEEMNKQYTQGYIAGKKEKKNGENHA